MTQGIILHRVADAEHCVKNKLHENNLLFSTHSSVDIYLRQFYGLDCQCLSGFLDLGEMEGYKQLSSERVDYILRLLDEKVSPTINKSIDLKMSYFVPLYSYLGKYHYSGYMFLAKSLEKVIKEFNLSKLIGYNYKFNDLLEVNTDLKALVKNFLNEIEITIIDYPKSKLQYWFWKYKYLKSIMKNVLIDPVKFINKIINRNRISFNIPLLIDRKTIVLFGNIDISILSEMHQYNAIHYSNRNRPSLIIDDGVIQPGRRIINLVKQDLNDSDIGGGKDLDRVFLQEVKQNFLEKIGNYLRDIKILEALNRKFPISLGIWGSPPMSGLTALLNEYLRSMGIPILGAQHGCIYGDAFEPWHFDSDFNRCNYYISYGFTDNDLKNLYPEKEIDIKILPLGYIKPGQSKKIKKNIDILFPITNSISIFAGGMIRLPPDKLSGRQIALLQYLNSLKGLNIYIKPFKYPNYDNFSVMPVLRKLKNLKLVDYLTFLEFIERYSPRAVLIEFPSQPLYEVMDLDVEIFLMHDPLHPFAAGALEELKKRVYYAEDTDEMISMLDRFIKGDLESKRDSTFYRHYVHKEDTKKNILQLINQLCEGDEINL